MNAATIRALVRLLRCSRGGSLVETALIFPILTTLLFGAVELAQVARAGIAVSNAARAGAQYGSQSGYSAQDTTGIQTAAANDAPNLNLTTSSSISCVCSDGTSSTCQNTDCSASHMEETVRVSTQTTVTPPIHIPGLPRTFTLKGQASQLCLQ